jgi:hypothetical protein
MKYREIIIVKPILHLISILVQTNQIIDVKRFDIPSVFNQQEVTGLMVITGSKVLFRSALIMIDLG